MSNFHEETIKVIRHLQRRLITLIDTAHTPEVLKNTVIDYLESLIQAGPGYIDAQEHYRPPAKRVEPPPRTTDFSYPFTARNPCHLPQQSSQPTGIRRFSSPTDRETIFHGVRIPRGCEVVELPSIKPYVRDFFFVEGNVRHFVSVDNRPLNNSSPSDRIIFHSTCPQRNNSSSNLGPSKGYRIHKFYPSRYPMDDRNYDNDDDMTKNEMCKVKPSQSRQSFTNEHYDIYDKYGQHSYLNLETHKPETDEALKYTSHYLQKPSVPCDHWLYQRDSCPQNGQPKHENLQLSGKDVPPEVLEEHNPSCLMKKRTGSENVQIKAEESIVNYENCLRAKYDTNRNDAAKTEPRCDEQDIKHPIIEVAEFEKELNRKYSTNANDSRTLTICDFHAKRQALNDSGINRVPESNKTQEPNGENMGDETFIKRMLNVDLLRSPIGEAEPEETSEL